MKLGLTSAEIGQRRIIEHIAIEQGKGEIWLNGKIERFTLDDLVDFAEMGEMLMLKHSGKMLNAKLRPAVKNRAACQFDVLKAGDASLYEGSDAPVQSAGSWYLRVEIDGNRWDNWFTRLDELVKMLYIIIKEAQGDPYLPPPSIVVPGVVGHA